MIAKDSKSYPYLAIAHYYNVSYAEVLKYSELIRSMNAPPPYTEWRLEVWRLEHSHEHH